MQREKGIKMKCNFCGKDLPIGGGKLYVKKEGTAYYLCSSKCEKNMVKLGRKSVKTRWTEEYNKLKKTLLSAKDKETKQ
jgi:large subunit ribosomal protein L24e